MSLLVVGSVALDTVTTPCAKAKEILGGSAVYSAVSAIFFSPVNLVAVVGRDFPSRHLSYLRQKRIDLAGLTVAEGKTFRWEGQYRHDFSDPRTIATHLNVFARFEPRLPEKYRSSEFIFLANIDPKLQQRVLKQVRRPRLVAADTMNYWIEHERRRLFKLFKSIDILLVNGSEARLLAGVPNLIKAARLILRYGPKVVVVKKGEHGVLLFSRGGCFAAPAFMLDEVFDPTGAGDTFAGAFMGYLAQARQLNQNTLRQAALHGLILASFTVEDFSLRRLGRLSRKDIARRMRLYKRYCCF